MLRTALFPAPPFSRTKERVRTRGSHLLIWVGVRFDSSRTRGRTLGLSDGLKDRKVEDGQGAKQFTNKTIYHQFITTLNGIP